MRSSQGRLKPEGVPLQAVAWRIAENIVSIVRHRHACCHREIVSLMRHISAAARDFYVSEHEGVKKCLTTAHVYSNLLPDDALLTRFPGVIAVQGRAVGGALYTRNVHRREYPWP